MDCCEDLSIYNQKQAEAERLAKIEAERLAQEEANVQQRSGKGRAGRCRA
ncbi:hypothetical protein J4731_19495 [Providencia rettgeri]|nr:hypothetical protein [Providencia rettgeri]